MLNFLCFFFVFYNAVTNTTWTLHHMSMFYCLTDQDNIKNLEGYIFKQIFIITSFWDGRPVVAQ